MAEGQPSEPTPSTVTPRSRCAVVVLFCTPMVTAPETAAVPPTVPATATSHWSSLCDAVTVSPVPPRAHTVSPAATYASTTPVRTNTTDATPMPAVDPTPTPPANRTIVTGSDAAMVTDPRARTVEGVSGPPSMYARVPGSLSPSFTTSTVNDPVTPAVEAAAPPATISVKPSPAVAVSHTEPPRSATTPRPTNARTSLLCTPTMRAKPTPALPVVSPRAPASSTSSDWSDAVNARSCAATTATFWFTRAASPRNARVVRFMTSTMTEPPTAASPPAAAAPRATAVKAGSVMSGTSGAASGTRDAVARPMIEPPASIVVGRSNDESMWARVVASTYWTTMAAPTPVPLVVNAPETARVWRPIGLLASRPTFPVTVRLEPSPMTASFTSCSTCTPTEPATLASPRPPAAEIAQVWKSLRAPVGVMPVIETEPAVIVAPAPIDPRLVTVTTLRPTAAPMLLLLVSRL